jgi:hypothetical protein
MTVDKARSTFPALDAQDRRASDGVSRGARGHISLAWGRDGLRRFSLGEEQRTSDRMRRNGHR